VPVSVTNADRHTAIRIALDSLPLDSKAIRVVVSASEPSD